VRGLGIGLVALGVLLGVMNVALGATSGDWIWFGTLLSLNGLTVACGAYIIGSD